MRKLGYGLHVEMIGSFDCIVFIRWLVYRSCVGNGGEERGDQLGKCVGFRLGRSGDYVGFSVRYK